MATGDRFAAESGAGRRRQRPTLRPMIGRSPKTEMFVASDGVEIFFRWWDGSGVPVVLLHGFIATGESNWVTTGVLDALIEAGRAVVAPDARGHGRSGKPLEPELYGEPRMAADTRELVDHLRFDAFDLMGYSMGAMVGLLIAGEDPRLRRLVLGGVGKTVVTDGGTAVDPELLARALEVDDPGTIEDETARQFRRFAEAMNVTGAPGRSCPVDPPGRVRPRPAVGSHAGHRRRGRRPSGRAPRSRRGDSSRHLGDRSRRSPESGGRNGVHPGGDGLSRRGLSVMGSKRTPPPPPRGTPTRRPPRRGPPRGPTTTTEPSDAP
ncbi:MAG TPA: alpha/beta fold hydrolase [Acidimicrobiia bacterium]|nr:alpha/beta fold hydrolase [Acidimicrobiia bacterium]